MTMAALYYVLADVALSLAIVYYDTDNVHIDWTSFGSQGDAVLDGIYDYEKIWGPKGWIAYPAGCAWLYAFLSYVRINQSYLHSQLLWTAFHALQTYLMWRIAEKTIPRKDLKFLCMAIYLLKERERFWVLTMLQNDFLMMLLMMVALVFVMENQIFMSILFYNLAFSIKVGVILWLPGYLLVLAKKRSMLCVVFFVIFTAGFQLAISWPFLQANTDDFIRQIFATDRRLGNEWTIIYYVFSEDVFLTHEFVLCSIVLMLSINLMFLLCLWTNWRSFFSDIRLWPLSLKLGDISAVDTIKIIFTSTLIQAAFWFQHHPQFLLWYTPIYPYLLATSGLPLEVIVPMSYIMEQGSFQKHSLILKTGSAIAHLTLLYRLFKEKKLLPLKVKEQ